MWFLVDNITAMVVSMVIFFLLASIQRRSMNQRVAQHSREAVVDRAQDLGDWLRKDLERIGDNMDPGENTPYDVAFENPEESGGTSRLTTELIFARDSVQASGPDRRVETRYRIEDAGSRVVGGTSQTVYQLRRSKRVGGSNWQPAGESVPSLSGFQVDFLDRNGNRIADPVGAAENDLDAVRTIRVRFYLVAPYQNKLLSLQVAHVGSVIVRYPMAEIRS